MTDTWAVVTGIIVLMAACCAFLVFMADGEVESGVFLLLTGSPLLFLLLPRLRGGSALQNRTLEAFLLIGIWLVWLGSERVAAGRAFSASVHTDLSRGDSASLLSAARKARWSGDSLDAEDAMRRTIVARARKRLATCSGVGDHGFYRSPRSLVWDMDKDLVHDAQHELGEDRYTGGPVTVFLVKANTGDQVGFYRISGQPAFREWVFVSVLQFDTVSDPGTCIAFLHPLLSLNPPETRTVQASPEYGNAAEPVADWIKQQQINPNSR